MRLRNLAALAVIAETIMPPLNNRVKDETTEKTFMAPKFIMPKKDYKKRQARIRMQKQSRKVNRY